MDEHHCLLCMGSNTNRYAQLSVAREALRATFPDIPVSYTHLTLPTNREV